MSFLFGFIGCGNMGGALALAASKALDAANLAVCDRDSAKTDTFGGKAEILSATEIATSCKYIILGVKPQVLDAAISEIKDILSTRTDRFIVVSMAAGKEISWLENQIGLPCPIIRIMPNTPANVGEGMILTAKNDLVTDKEIEEFTAALRYAGKFDIIPESLIDAGGALSGCGPAFVYMFADALSNAGEQCGLPKDKALLYAAQTLKGAAEMLLNSTEEPSVLTERVCSPGGTTIEGVKALKDGNFQETAAGAVIAAYRKTELLK